MLGESIHRRLLDASTEVMVVLLDLDGRIVYASAGARSVLGFEPEELLGRRADEVVAPGLAAEARISFDVILQGRSLRHRRGLARRADGLHAHVRFDATPLPGDDGKIEGVVVTAQLADRDLVSPEATASETPSEERTGGEGAGELIERLPAVVYVAEPGPQGPWLYVSQQIEQLLGYEREQWLSDPTMWANRVHPDDLESVLASEGEDLAGTSTSFETEYRMVTRDGRIVWVRDEAVLRRDAEGRPRYDGLLIDVTDRKRIESQLQFFAEHDHLTGLRNRRRFLDELDLEIRRGRRHDEPVSVLMLDLDKLKDVNDTLGHSAGDSLIRATAEALRSRLRESDTVARLGGDEFAILARGAGAVEAAEIAEDLVIAIREASASLAPVLEPTGASVGVAELRRRFTTPDQALAAADAAMYEAKRRGGGRVAMQAADRTRVETS
jgi:diguanylate cyclase (GGDEF)-like protein/PAS domain S-box-containing protein